MEDSDNFDSGLNESGENLNDSEELLDNHETISEKSTIDQENAADETSIQNNVNLDEPTTETVNKEGNITLEENLLEIEDTGKEIHDQESIFEEDEKTDAVGLFKTDAESSGDCQSSGKLELNEMLTDDAFEDQACISESVDAGANTQDKPEIGQAQHLYDNVGSDFIKSSSVNPHDANTSSANGFSSEDNVVEDTAPGGDLMPQQDNNQSLEVKTDIQPCVQDPVSTIVSKSSKGVTSLDLVSGAKNTTTPGKPKVWQISPLKAGIAWMEPTQNPDKIIAYTIKVKCLDDNLWKSVRIPAPQRNSSHQIETELQIQPNAPHVFVIVAIYEEDAISDDSELSDEFLLDATVEEVCKAKAIEASVIERNGNPTVHQINLKKTYEKEDGSIQKFEYGVPDLTSSERVIMIVGATGAGKSTLINGMVNYMFGLDWDDNERLKLIPEQLNHNQAESQTKAISSYTIHHEPGLKVPFTVTIIDTPGFGDTGGYNRDEQITEQIREFFTTAGTGGIDHIDAVGFVTQSSLPRLTPTQRYIFDKILSLFGKDIEDNILMLLTFADAQKPPVLSGIKEAGFKYSEYFKFNNSAIFAEKEENARNQVFNKMFWEMGEESFKTFFDAIGKFESKSLTLTKEVLMERHQLELYVMKMQDDIKLGLNKLENLTNELNVVLHFEALIDANKEFDYTVEEDFIGKRDIPCGQYTTNCITCNKTCHENCRIPDDRKKARCSAMDRAIGLCRICPQNCPWENHKNMPFVMVVNRRTVKKTSAELYARYQQGMEGKITTEGLIQQLHEDFESHQTSTLMLTEEVRQTVEHLNEIALKPNSLSTLDYIDTLIDSEIAEQRPGYRQRVGELKKLRTRTEVFIKMVDQGADPFSDYRVKIMEMKEKEKTERTVFGRFQSFVSFSWTKVKEGLRRQPKKRRGKRGERTTSGNVPSSRV